MGVLALALHDDGETGDVDAEHGVGAVGAEGAEGAEHAEDVDAEGVVLVVEGHVGAGGEGAVEGDVRVGVVEGAGGAVGEGVGAVEDGGAVGAVEVVGDAEGGAVGAVGEESEGTVVVAAGHVGAAVEPVGAVGVEDVADEDHVDMEFAEHVEGENTGVGVEAEHVGAEAGGGGDHVDDTAHLHSCRLSASFCSVSVERGNGLVQVIRYYCERKFIIRSSYSIKTRQYRNRVNITETWCSFFLAALIWGYIILTLYDL